MFDGIKFVLQRRMANQTKVFSIASTNHLGSSESQEPTCEIAMNYQDVRLPSSFVFEVVLCERLGL